MTDPTPLPAALAGPTAHRFLSPHYDDIALSVGGTVRLLADAGRQPGVDLIFGSEPDPDAPLTEFADELHRAWGLDAATVIAGRRAEEAGAGRVLGTSTAFLPFRDAIYRGRNYIGNPMLFGDVAAAERDLPDAVAEAVLGQAGPPAGARVYAPLGVGRHVDHQVAFLAGVLMAENGWDVWFYEDLPYAINPGARDTRVASLAATTPVEVAGAIDVRAVWDAKLDAILAYPSQLVTVFDYVGSGATPPEIDATMRHYAESVGNGIASERFWRLSREV